MPLGSSTQVRPVGPGYRLRSRRLRRWNRWSVNSGATPSIILLGNPSVELFLWRRIERPLRTRGRRRMLPVLSLFGPNSYQGFHSTHLPPQGVLHPLEPLHLARCLRDSPAKPRSAQRTRSKRPAPAKALFPLCRSQQPLTPARRAQVFKRLVSLALGRRYSCDLRPRPDGLCIGPITCECWHSSRSSARMTRVQLGRNASSCGCSSIVIVE